MNGRHFDQRTISATIATGGEQFKKTRKTDRRPDKDMDDQERLEQFGKLLEQDKI